MIKLRIQQIKLKFDHKKIDLENRICDIIHISKVDIISYKIIKKSIDARKSNDIVFLYTVDVVLKNRSKPVKVDKNIIMLTKEEKYTFSVPKIENHTNVESPIIIGSGPAGLFCALLLAENGFKPIVLERGSMVDKRIQDVNKFFESGQLNPQSNIQFGEGGAGTFSDGKLNTQVKDPFYRKDKILNAFIEAGAPEEIGYMNKPHIGTNYLVTVVKNIRERIISLGGTFKFDTLVTDLIIENKQVNGVVINNNVNLFSKHIVLAIGHSARDTFFQLNALGIPMEAKAFAIGLRIEHSQETISKNQYGKNYKHENLPVADYKLTYRSTSGRGVYTFCMCPGGYVVNATSEAKHLVCNGMSNFERNSLNANSAILVNVTPEDFEGSDVLAGVSFQRKWEEKAFKSGGSDYSMPIQLLEDFIKNRESKALGVIKPHIKGKYAFANLNNCLPVYVCDAIKEGVMDFEKKINGFANKDAVLTGVETRSSSPVRILRNEEFESEIKGLFPCGEGAGYAGGIMSAAIDGIKVAEQIAGQISKQ